MYQKIASVCDIRTFYFLMFFITVEPTVIAGPNVTVMDKVVSVKLWLIASDMPRISLKKNGIELDITDENKYGIKKAADSLELLLFNPIDPYFGDYTIQLWTATAELFKEFNVTLSRPLG